MLHRKTFIDDVSHTLLSPVARAICFTAMHTVNYGITGCGVFKAGIQNWKGFCLKINCSQMKLLNFENWTNGEPQ